MLDRNYKDVVAGGLIAFMGVMIAAHSFLNLDLGTARRMGPGMVPFWLGLLLLVLGGSIGLKGFRSPAVTIAKFPMRPLIFVILAIGSFALAAPHVGVIPAVFVLILVASLAEGKLNPLRMLLLATGLAIFCFVVFDMLLQLTMPMFDWRF